MTRIRWQIIRNVAVTFLLTCLVILAILAIGQLTQLLKQVASGQLPLPIVLQLLGLAVPTLLVTVLPLAFFFAVYLVFNNLYRSNEMVAIRSTGTGLIGLLPGVAFVLGVVFCLELALSLSWAPAAQRTLQAESERLANAAAEAMLQPGSFTSLPGGRVIYVGSAIGKNTHRYHEIFLSIAHGKQSDMASAAYGEIIPGSDGGLSLVLIDGQRYLGLPGQNGFKVLSFARYRVMLGSTVANNNQAGGINWDSASLPTLLSHMQDQDRRYAVTELQWRLIWPIALPLLALLAIPLAYSEPRGGGRAAGMLLGVLLLLAINNILIYFKEHMMSGKMPLYPGFFWVVLFIGVIAFYTFWRRNRDLGLLPVLFRQGVS
ncbi:LPS export ABC transporter permease LptF [Acidithiobacillus montserratensis]|uniref:LPS export ABC transporter permease LptF n=1 Tax=Acidithiobacillus montserratensis TaxID=2729135 RepID=A0ACD5HCE3_9PROT|nr:LPS export ABC transporter permease LptF [Acidithiobacillus montserratensis]MBU2748956.1 LPS export ABC transporter permease LptF [Acidithiobacillus montserratensis]